MIRITPQDFKKLNDFLRMHGQDGAYLSFDTGYSSAVLVVKTVDKYNKEIRIELSDVDYPFMPRVTRTETI